MTRVNERPSFRTVTPGSESLTEKYPAKATGPAFPVSDLAPNQVLLVQIAREWIDASSEGFPQRFYRAVKE